MHKKLDRIKELVNLLTEYNEAYYHKNDELVSNNEYDKLYDELLELEKESGIIMSNSVTQKVGYTLLSNLTKIPHKTPMLSLDKTKDVEKLRSFLGSHKGILSWKLDGLTIVLTYKNGELQQGITRGNGEIGEDITHNAKVFANLPLKIPYMGELVLRGEGVIGNQQFEKINDKLDAEQKYKNPRNLCSGTVRQLNSEIVANRGVQFITFGIISKDDEQFESKEESFEWIKSLGFDVVDYEVVNSVNIADVVGIFKDKITSEDIGSDGLVITFDSISYSESLGTTSKFPKDSIAFKWADEMAETKLLDIEWNTSRTGLMNPIAIFEPVDLEGTEVSRASLHNVSILQALKLGIGDTIKVYKANMIIPQIAENITQSGNVKIPDKCSVCNGDTKITKVKDVEALYCLNPLCSAKKIQQFAHFVSRNALNIEGLSEETLSKFIEKGFLNDFSDIFQLERYENDIKEMEGFGERSYSKLIKSVDKAKIVELPNFIYALGIDQVGLSNAKLLCKALGYSLDDIKSAKQEKLENIDGFGEVIAKSIVDYFKNKESVAVVDKVVEFLDIKQREVVEIVDNPLKDVTFVVTGDVEKFKNRKELGAYIEKFGGKVTGSVTKKTNYLINNDTFSESSKNKKAKDLGVPIISENQFIEMFNVEI